MAKFNVELEHTDWQLVLNVLSSGAYRDVASVINKITQQLTATSPGNGEVRLEGETHATS